MNIFVNGVRLHVEVEGTGHPFIMLHGLAGDSQSLRTDIDAFSPGFRTIAIDCRGHGRSDHPPHFTLADHVRDVLAVMDELGVDSTYLIGTSMGSYVAQGVAIAAPQRVKKLILVAPKANGARSSSEQLLQQHGAQLSGATPEQQRAFLRGRILAPTSPERRTALLAEMDRSGATLLNAEETAATRRALENFDFRPQLHTITARTLVISGRHDPLNPPSDGQVIAERVPDCRLEILENSGHAPRLEEREAYLRLVRSFLEQ